MDLYLARHLPPSPNSYSDIMVLYRSQYIPVAGLDGCADFLVCLYVRLS